MFMHRPETFAISAETALPGHGFPVAAGRLGGGLPATALVESPTGWSPAGRLQPGMAVQTWDGGLQTIRAIRRRRLSGGGRIVRLPGGAFDNCAAIDLAEEAQVLIAHPIVEEVLGQGAVLISARDLLGLRGAALAPAGTVMDLVHPVFDAEEAVFVNTGLMLHCPAAGARDHFTTLAEEGARALVEMIDLWSWRPAAVRRAA